MNIQDFLNAVLKQDAERLRTYFSDSAYINWHCTNEHFTVEEYIQANCEYPGTWDGTIERIEQIGDLIITAVNVYSVDRTSSFHVVSFIKLKDDKIIAMDEYWGDDGSPPQWRLAKRLGRKYIPNGSFFATLSLSIISHKKFIVLRLRNPLNGFLFHFSHYVKH